MPTVHKVSCAFPARASSTLFSASFSFFPFPFPFAACPHPRRYAFPRRCPFFPNIPQEQAYPNPIVVAGRIVIDLAPWVVRVPCRFVRPLPATPALPHTRAHRPLADPPQREDPMRRSWLRLCAGTSFVGAALVLGCQHGHKQGECSSCGATAAATDLKPVPASSYAPIKEEPVVVTNELPPIPEAKTPPET